MDGGSRSARRVRVCFNLLRALERTPRLLNNRVNAPIIWWVCPRVRDSLGQPFVFWPQLRIALHAWVHSQWFKEWLSITTIVSAASRKRNFEFAWLECRWRIHWYHSLSLRPRESQRPSRSRPRGLEFNVKSFEPQSGLKREMTRTSRDCNKTRSHRVWSWAWCQWLACEPAPPVTAASYEWFTKLVLVFWARSHSLVITSTSTPVFALALFLDWAAESTSWGDKNLPLHLWHDLPFLAGKQKTTEYMKYLHFYNIYRVYNMLILVLSADFIHKMKRKRKKTLAFFLWFFDVLIFFNNYNINQTFSCCFIQIQSVTCSYHIKKEEN